MSSNQRQRFEYESVNVYEHAMQGTLDNFAVEGYRLVSMAAVSPLVPNGSHHAGELGLPQFVLVFERLVA